MPDPDLAQHESLGNKWVIAITAMTGTFMAVMDISVVNVALPHMMGTYGESRSAITWVATSYSIAEIIMATMAGWWSSLLGRKRLYLGSYSVFIVGSVLCGIAPSFQAMLLFRVIQGIGGGALIPVSQAILREAFPEEQQGMAMAFYGMGVVIAPGVGAILGGYLTDRFGWPWIFYINVPVCIFGITMVALFIKDPHYLRRGVRRIDWIGIALLTAGLTGLQVVLERGQQDNWFASNFILFGTAVTVIVLIALVFWELRVEHPVVDFRILKNIPLSVGSAIGVIFGIGLFGSTFIIPQVTQELLGYPALESGLTLLPRALALFAIMPIAGALYRYVNSKLLVLFGLLMLSGAFYFLNQLNTNVGVLDFLLPLVMMGCGMPFVFVTLSTVALSTVPRESMTEATSLFTLSRRVGGNIGYAFAATIVSRRTQFHHARLGSHVNELSASYHAFVQHASALLHAHGVSSDQVPAAALAMANNLVNQQAVMMAYNDTAYIIGIMFLATIPLVFLLPKAAGRTKRAKAPAE